MTIPRENWIAAFPSSVKTGNVILRPLTLGGAIRLARIGVETNRRVPREKLFEAAFILSGETDQRRFLKRVKCGLQELSNAVETVLNEAYETWVKAASEPNQNKVGHLTPHGIGWPLEYIEFLCAEYGWSFREALDTPVATAYALEVACRQRHGGRHAGFDYIERQYRKDLKSGRAKPIRIDN